MLRKSLERHVTKLNRTRCRIVVRVWAILLAAAVLCGSGSLSHAAEVEVYSADFEAGSFPGEFSGGGIVVFRGQHT